MFRAYSYPLLLTKEQEITLDLWRTACCDLYNGALQNRRDAWRRQRVGVRYNEQCAELAELRAADTEWRDIPSVVSRSALRRLEHAMEAFFRRVKTGQVPGFPRFRSEERYNSFGIGRARIDGDRVNVPKLGPVRFKLYRSLGGAVRHVSIIRTARGWTLRVFCDLGDAPAKIPVLSATGIDVGLETFATLSNGERVENPRFFRVSAELIARRQRSLSSKKRGSNSRKAAKKLFARTHEHIRNQRLDFSRKLACFLFSRFDLIAYEDLQIARMAHGKLAKSIYDAAWGKTINALVCKAESAGKWAIATDPRGTSIDCSGCGQSVPKDLSQREHRCPKCGLVLHRDENAARNVLARGLRAGLLTEAVRQNPKEEISLVIQDA